MSVVALVGCAHTHTDNYVDKLAAHPDVQMRWVWDHDAGRAATHAARLGATVAPEAAVVWADPEVAAVVVCSETVHHRELVSAAAGAGKHVFVEKPLGFGSDDAYEMADAVEASGVLFQTSYFKRGDPINRFLRGEIAAGHLGAVTRMRASLTHAGVLEGWFDDEWRWMADRELAGFGGFGDLGTHCVDLLLWLSGDSREVREVTASVHAVTNRYGDCDEYGEGMLVFDDGMVGTVAAGWASVRNPVQLEVCGTEGHAHVVNGRLFYRSRQVAGARGDTAWTQLPEALPHSFDLFLDAVLGSTDTPLVGAREAASRSAVVEALYRGAYERAWVSPRFL